MLKRVFVDDSALCKLFDDNFPIEQAAARNLIGDVENFTLVTSALSLATFFEEVTTRFSRSLQPVTAKQAVNDLTELTVVQLDSDLVVAATETQTSLDYLNYINCEEELVVVKNNLIAFYYINHP